MSSGNLLKMTSAMKTGKSAFLQVDTFATFSFISASITTLFGSFSFVCLSVYLRVHLSVPSLAFTSESKEHRRSETFCSRVKG